MTANEIIELLRMQPLPTEGGYFAVTHVSDERLAAEALPSRYSKSRQLSGAIYYLVTLKQFSALHRLTTDELYYFHYGDPLEMLLLAPDGHGERRILGMMLQEAQEPQLLAPRHWWQGSRPLPGGTHGFTLVSTSMAPAYDESDPEFGDRYDLTGKYPEFTGLVKALTRI